MGSDVPQLGRSRLPGEKPNGLSGRRSDASMVARAPPPSSLRSCVVDPSRDLRHEAELEEHHRRDVVVRGGSVHESPGRCLIERDGLLQEEVAPRCCGLDSELCLHIGRNRQRHRIDVREQLLGVLVGRRAVAAGELRCLARVTSPDPDQLRARIVCECSGVYLPGPVSRSDQSVARGVTLLVRAIRSA